MATAKVLPRPEKRKSRDTHHGTRLPTNFFNAEQDDASEFEAFSQGLAVRCGVSLEYARLVLTLLRGGSHD
jgi:hypothetical protein